MTRPGKTLTILCTALVLAVVAAVTAALFHRGATTADGGAVTASATSGAELNGTRVLVISLDGLSVRALVVLGRDGAPHLHRVLGRGAATRNARTQVEQTVTLPNHVSMVTGRRIDPDANGHGVTWNVHKPGTTVQGAAGEDVSSVFEVVDAAGGTTAVFSTKEKFSIFDRSWPEAVHRSTIKVEQDGAVARAALTDLVEKDRAFTFLHLGKADEVGHHDTWLSPAYLTAVRRLDALVGTVLATIRGHDLDDVVVVLTADHGGMPGTTSHADPSELQNFRVPFAVWGPGVADADLYELNPQRGNPGRQRILFDFPQPIRNGDVANLSLDLLGLGPVPDSRWNFDQQLAWN